MNWTVRVGFVLVLIGAALALAQLWLELWPPETFIKMMITLGVLLGLDIAWNLVVREKRDSAKLPDKNQLDP
jgi:hypothetical protein